MIFNNLVKNVFRKLFFFSDVVYEKKYILKETWQQEVTLKICFELTIFRQNFDYTSHGLTKI